MATPAHAHIEPRAAVPCLRAEVALRHRLRQPVLIVRSIAANLSHHTGDPALSLSDMEQQDLLLCERLQALLALHRHRLRASSPTRMSTGIVPPACAPSVFLSGSAVVEVPAALDVRAARSPALHHHSACTLHLARKYRQQRHGAGDACASGNAATAPAGRQRSDGRGCEEDVRAAGVEAPPRELGSTRPHIGL
ncbi:hypothetical protein DFH08DRAFT_1036639 [Mycena albidolilacea]|uniref:Uncharacterized protein n=1 Tax=Mycena albidolilacea TaxID=1033008 RepID=A0AAD6ZDW2_9AGAR|nr:hypothetical protein DFH08DRAFT_1036639 [Mycena albidolilacea]